MSLVDGSSLEQNYLLLQVEVDQEIVTTINNDSISSSVMANTKQTNHKETGRQGLPARFPKEVNLVEKLLNTSKRHLKMTITILLKML